MKGEVVYLYAFDVANEIVTAKVKDILASTPVPFEIRADHTLPKDIPLYKPLAIEHSPLSASLAGMQVRPLIHVYDVGVVSIAMRIAFDVKDLAELMPFHNIQLANGQRLEYAARDLCIEACKSLEKAMIQAAPLPEPEAYTIFCRGIAEILPDASLWQGSGYRQYPHPLRAQWAYPRRIMGIAYG